MARVAIVIVTHNSAACIGACLDSLPVLADYEIVVVDNASLDASVEQARKFPGVVVIANPDNRGFAAAVNQGVRATKAPLVLILNPDTRSIRGIDHLAEQFSDSATGATGGMLTDAKGSPQIGFMYRRLPTPTALIFEVFGINHLWPRNPSNWNYRCLGNNPMAPCLVEQPAGAFLMFSRTAWQQVGGFSERFFPIWFEDVDFCASLMAHGFAVRYDPAATAIHDGGHSIRLLTVEKRERYWYGSLLEYAAGHYGPLTYRAVCFAVLAGAILRAVRSLPRISFNVLAGYGAVCRLALGRLFSPRRQSGSSVLSDRWRENS